MRMVGRNSVEVMVLAAMLAVLSACSTTPPANIKDSCSIFEEKDGWYKAAKHSRDKWGMPIHVQLAIMYQESSFKHDAKPGWDYLLWVIPWGRKSSAYGYAQVKDDTWNWYRSKSGNSGADRDDFADAVDFIGWYGDISQKTLGISKWDAFNQYLAYHEGHGGFKRKTYKQKKWLITVARKVEQRAAAYREQLARCEGDLDSGWWFWPF